MVVDPLFRGKTVWVECEAREVGGSVGERRMGSRRGKVEGRVRGMCWRIEGFHGARFSGLYVWLQKGGGSRRVVIARIDIIRPRSSTLDYLVKDLGTTTTETAPGGGWCRRDEDSVAWMSREIRAVGTFHDACFDSCELLTVAETWKPISKPPYSYHEYLAYPAASLRR